MITPQEQLAELEAKMAVEAAEQEGMPSTTEIATAGADIDLADATADYERAVADARAARHESWGVVKEVKEATKTVRWVAKPVRHPVKSTSATAPVVDMDLAELRQRVTEIGE